MSEKMLITHHLWTALQKRGLSKTNKHLARFAHEEDGVVTAMALFFVLMMCLVGGIGVDRSCRPKASCAITSPKQV
jgi:hypothetical protein